MKSVWRETKLPEFSELRGDVKTDVLIIGGGLAGILTAYLLQQNGVDYVLAEKGRICSGNTGNTTAKITVQHGLIYDKIAKSYGIMAAEKYLTANTIALDKYCKMCKDFHCDFEVKDNFVYSVNNSKKLYDELETLQKIGYDAELVDQLPLPIKTVGAVKFKAQAQFNPLKFVSNIISGLNIYENTHVIEMKGNTAVTKNGKIKADRVISATHFPFINKHGAYFIKLYQHRSYVIALDNAPDVGGMYVDENDSGMSFRNYDGLLLLGGGGGRTGKKNGNWNELRAFKNRHYPDAREEYYWAAQDCMTLDGIPYIGHYSNGTLDFYVETGFNKWGMTSSMVSAMIICDMLLGKQSEYADIFSPSRSILKPQLFINGIESVLNLLTPSKKVCPHLGCALKWNKAEHSWDCPCHGSRFSEDGKLLDNPSNGDLE